MGGMRLGSLKTNLTGRKFGRLTVVGLSHRDKKSVSFWLVKCDCGVEKTVNGQSLQRGTTASCGCLRREIMSRVMRGAFNR